MEQHYGDLPAEGPILGSFPVAGLVRRARRIADGRVVIPMGDNESIRDGADRLYPSHLDTILDPRPGEWWADIYGLARPPETFHRDRRIRDAMRRRSVWEVRVKQHRHDREPPDPQREMGL